MNKQIQKFADKAKKSVPHGLTPDKWIEVYNQTFAELIVQECVLISRTSTSGFSAGDRMKEHFGLNNE